MKPKAEQAPKVQQTGTHSRIVKFLQEAAAIAVAIFCLLLIIVLLHRPYVNTFSRERLGVSWADYLGNSKEELQRPHLPAYTS